MNRREYLRSKAQCLTEAVACEATICRDGKRDVTSIRLVYPTPAAWRARATVDTVGLRLVPLTGRAEIVIRDVTRRLPAGCHVRIEDHRYSDANGPMSRHYVNGGGVVVKLVNA